MPKVMLPLAAQPLWLPTENLAAGPWEPVCAPVRLASAAASVSFASIPAQYVMFRLIGEIINDASAADIYFKFNADSGANYDVQVLGGNGVTVSSTRTTGGSSGIHLFGNASMAASTHLTFVLTIAKPIAGAAALSVCHATGYNGANFDIHDTAGRWANTADLINQIAFSKSAGNFAAGSIFILEGSKF